MKILNFNDTFAASLEPRQELITMLRALTGRTFTKDLPIKILDCGNPNPTRRKITKTVENLDTGKITTETWIETLPPAPLRIAQTKDLRATITWEAIDNYSPADDKEPAEKKPTSGKKPTSKKEPDIVKALVAQAMKNGNADKLAKLIEQLMK